MDGGTLVILISKSRKPLFLDYFSILIILYCVVFYPVNLGAQRL